MVHDPFDDTDCVAGDEHESMNCSLGNTMLGNRISNIKKYVLTTNLSPTKQGQL